MNHEEIAVSCFDSGFVCSQAILSTFGPRFGLNRELALRVAGAFGGGKARIGETCGAVTGALMAIGLCYSKVKPEDDEAKEFTYRLVNRFVEEFKQQYGSIHCRDLLGYDISTVEGRQLAKQNDLFDTKCRNFVRSSPEILESLLDAAKPFD
ncbi:MAG: C_GCAxxG_C_C family protein [Planctomycetes bacterium]|nr:C_GCAxxG_C_C family protein [Planctomycetota bacterium]